METTQDNTSDADAELSDGGLKIVLESPKRKSVKKLKPARKLEPSEFEILEVANKELDENLDAKAAKINLSTMNVKSILRQVVTNEHVLALVRRREDPQDPQARTKLPFEPKLTRAKAKELYSPPPLSSMPWLSPTKPSSEVQKLITDELAEDSSGDEYVPAEEESEDDPDNCVLSETELRSISPLTPVKEPESPNDFHWTDDGMFKIPPIKSKETEDDANIALRTRSKLCLSSTPLETIEEAFIPPDITTDMYDMDCDNDDWCDFLKKFTRPLDEVTKPTEDEEHDPEYNILADEEVDKVDKEELRADKAVKVSRKEFNDMLAELFECANNFDENLDENVLSVNSCTDTQQEIIPETNSIVDINLQSQNASQVTIPIEVFNISTIEPASEVNFTDTIRMDQKLLLEQQIRQQVQLLSQNFLLTYQHPEYHAMSTEFKEILYNYQCLSELKENSMFKACNLDGAVNLVKHWETQFQLNTDEIKEMKEYVCRVLHESQTNTAAGIEYVVTFPPLIMETIAKSDVFMYPDLLPIIPFKSAALFNKKIDTYTTSEDQLIALGLEKFTPDLAQDTNNLFRGQVKLKAVCSLIKTYLTPTKDLTKLYCHMFNSRHPKSSGNPIRYYFQNKRAPVVIHYVRSLEEFGLVSPSKRRKEMLPYQWKSYLYPNSTDQIQIIQNIVISPPISTIKKVHKPPAYNKGFSNKNLRRRSLKGTSITPQRNVVIIKPNPTPVPINCTRVNYCPALKATPSLAKKQLDQYFKSPKLLQLDILNSKIKSLKFNSSIFNNLKAGENQDLTMLPSMPCLGGGTTNSEDVLTKQSNQVEKQSNQVENAEVDVVNIDCDDEVEEETVEKDNEDDINVLMVASSTIKNTNRRVLPAGEKKRAKLQREFIANLAILTPEDPIFLQEKAQSYSQAYFDKAKERLTPEEYKEFMEILNNFDENACKVSELYKQIENIIGKQHTDLMEEFLTFLTPSQARDIGKLIPYYMLNNMSLFLRKLEIYFKDQPAQLRKIYRSFTYLTTCVDVNMERVKSTILPLLKGNGFLTDWFLQIFPCEPPPPSLLNGVWEQIDARREFNATEDIFETVTLPDAEDQYGGINCMCSCHEREDVAFKTRTQHCMPCSIRFLQGRVHIQTGKGLRLANVTFGGNSTIDHNLRLNGLSADKRKRRSEVSPAKQFTSPTKDNQDEPRLAIDSEDETENTRRKSRISKSPRKKRVKFRDASEKLCFEEPNEVPSSIACDEVLTNVVSAEIAVVQEEHYSNPSTSFANCTDTFSKPVVEDVGEWDCNASIESVEIRQSPEHSAGSESEFCEESSQDNINTETDDSAEELESLSNSPVHSENSNSNNADEEVSWTRDEDKIILETLQKEGGKDPAFIRISEILQNRSVIQIKERFITLMNLLQKMTSSSEPSLQN